MILRNKTNIKVDLQDYPLKLIFIIDYKRNRENREKTFFILSSAKLNYL